MRPEMIRNPLWCIFWNNLRWISRGTILVMDLPLKTCPHRLTSEARVTQWCTLSSGASKTWSGHPQLNKTQNNYQTKVTLKISWSRMKVQALDCNNNQIIIIVWIIMYQRSATKFTEISWGNAQGTAKIVRNRTTLTWILLFLNQMKVEHTTTNTENGSAFAERISTIIIL